MDQPESRWSNRRKAERAKKIAEHKRKWGAISRLVRGKQTWLRWHNWQLTEGIKAMHEGIQRGGSVFE